MISFIWSPGHVLPAGTGGSENYTVGQVRELKSRGIAAQVVTVGLGKADGRDEFVDIPFLALASLSEVSDLEGAVVFVNEPHVVATKNPSFQILHNPPPIRESERAFATEGTRDRTLIATSRYAAAVWAEYLDVDVETIAVVYPFAELAFGAQRRPNRPGPRSRVLYAGRLSPEKGIYTLLAMLHIDIIEKDTQISVTVTTAGTDKPQGRLIEQMLVAHPGIRVVPARRTPAAMAELMSENDVVIMPSNSQYWHETFGIVSLEAQHAGCRVVASDDGGLPETDCGALILVEPDNAEALAWGLRNAIANGPVSPATRAESAKKFTVADSVSQLLDVLTRPRTSTPASITNELEALVKLPSSPPSQHVRWSRDKLRARGAA